MKRLAPSLPVGARRTACAGAALSLLLAAQPAAAHGVGSRGDPLRTFDIPAMDASEGLVRLCLEADCELALVGRTRGVRTQAVRGRMTWRQALDRMLGDTGLRRRFIGARGVRVWVETGPAPARPVPSLVEPEAVEVEPVVVVGRLSEQIDQSLRLKREADVISDGVSTARLGDLPAANLAEALQRAPGVAIEREVGEGQFVSVRGLGPLFQSVTLNGAPVAFNENIRNSTQSGRQFRFRALSADLLAGARLTKSATPDLIDGGIGSNIDIETTGGLDGEPFVTLRVGAGLETRTGRASPDASVAGRWVSRDGDMGVVAGVAQEERSVLYDRFQIQRYRDLVVDGRTVAVPNDVRTTLEREDRRRRSAFVGADWIASPDLSLDLDALVSTFDNAIREDRVVFGLGERLQAPGTPLTIRDGVVTAADVADGQVDNNTEFSDQAHLNLVVSAGAVARLGEWRVTPRVSGSVARSVLDTPLERFSARSSTGVGYVFDVDGAADDRKAARLTTNLDLLDPGLLTVQRLGVRAVRSQDEDLTLLLDARRRLDWGWVSGVRLGGQMSDRSRDYQRRDREAILRPGIVAPDLHGGSTPDDAFRRLIRQGAGPWVTADFGAVRDAFHIPGEVDGVIFRPSDVEPTGTDRQNSYRVGERVAAAYVRFDLDGRVGEAPVFGNFGLRWVETRTEVDGSILGVTSGGALEVRPERYAGSHRVWLPSANLAFEFGEDHLLRLAASRTLTRPSLADLRSATVPASTLVAAIYNRGQAEIDRPSPGTIFTGVGGNPALKPYLSTNLDLSWEWTLPRGAFSLAVFHKTIDDFILTAEADEPLVFETRAGAPVTALVRMSRPRNAGTARISGVEVGLHRRFAWGFGIWASGTWTDSAARERETGRTRALTGVSDTAYMLNPFFERGPFSVSLSWSWRSAFRSEADMQGGGVSEFVVAPAGYLDAQASWTVSDRVEVVATASNLTDATEMSYEWDEGRLLQLGRAGRSFGLGLRWTL